MAEALQRFPLGLVRARASPIVSLPRYEAVKQAEYSRRAFLNTTGTKANQRTRLLPIETLLGESTIAMAALLMRVLARPAGLALAALLALLAVVVNWARTSRRLTQPPGLKV